MDFNEDKHIVETFLEETREHLMEIENGMLVLEKGGWNNNDELVHSMFRAAHSIKAGANLLKFRNIESLSHEMESTLQKLRQRKLALNKEIVDIFLKGIDNIEIMIKELKHSYAIL